MGIFDGILICSDLDGTFEKEKTYPLPQRNIDAVNYFIENGGMFTFCTGRLSGHLESRGMIEFTNAPLCLCNGALVYDCKKEQFIKQSFLSHTVRQIVYEMRDFLPYIKRFHFAIDNQYIILDESIAERYNDEKYNVIPNKIVFVFDNADDAKRFKQTAKKRFKCYDASQSWDLSVEFVDINNTKGHALDFIKEYVGAHTSIGIGNYGNDLSLLQHADIGVAVGDASDEIKANADMIVCQCEQDAIADLIHKLEKRLTDC